jgi:hypothetical protein
MSKMVIKIRPSMHGELHRDLGIAQDHNIPVSKLMEAKHSKNPAVRRRAIFALNARKFKH